MFPYRFALSVILAAGLFSAYGCTTRVTEPSPTRPADEAIRETSAVTELKARIDRDGFVTFHNFDGKFVKMDGDIDLRLLQNGKAVLIYNVLQINRSEGHYKLDPCGTLFTVFDPAPFLGWPVLELTRDNKSLLLTDSSGDEDAHSQGEYTFRPIRSKYETNFKD